MKKNHLRTRIATSIVSGCFLLVFFTCVSVKGAGLSEPIIINHNNTDITVLTEAAILRAKANLHIAYGHTSHGSQLTTGMNGLVAFANGGGLGLSLPHNIFAWNNGGSDGALDLHDYAMGGDVGYWPQWYNNTLNYLNNPANSDVNVIIWSWCGQVDSKYSAGTLDDEYLLPMSQLEAMYPDVIFVYMTGHVDFWDDADNKAANQMIRDYVTANNKVLYDFADIERYDPDNTYYEFVNDNCDYYDSAGGTRLGNWATEWQNSHTEGVDWYRCSSAHSQPLNANRKAYAAWHLWTRLGDVFTSGVTVVESSGSTSVTEGGAGDSYQIVLESQPTANVTITATPDSQTNLGSGQGNGISLTFTDTDWNEPQTVNVSAHNDEIKECRHSSTIVHSAASTDESYNGLGVDSVVVTIHDDDKTSCMLLNIIPVLIYQQSISE